jgi:hypothetical protein|tara:strand:+ start:386 stop:2236 length:1851 start_codon:yes stop_codon:yes gene_type:complete
MNKQYECAKALLDQQYSIIPLYKDQKFNGDEKIIERDYTLDHLTKPLKNDKGKLMWDIDGNLGLNLEKSKLIDIDLENSWSIKFGKLWLDNNTLTLGRERPNGVIEITHYFYKNEDNEDEDNILDKHIAEYRVEGQTVVYGSTKDKVTGEMLMRTWGNVKLPIADRNLEKKFRKISFAAAIAPHVESGNTGALKLDACLMRYTDWSDDERIEFLFDFYSMVLPNDRDTNRKKMQRVVKANNQKTKNAGYVSFADYIGVEPPQMKKWLGWIGNTPDKDQYKSTPSRRDFLANGIDLKGLMTTDIPPLRYAVNPILPEGLVCIAGRPKAMKSWLMYKLCFCVENGLNFLGHKVEQGNALYLALEDSKRRLKERAFKMGHEKNKNFPTTDIEAPYLGMGLEEDLQKWIDGVSKPKLIVVDTLARVKAAVGFKKGTAYDIDNELLRKLQHLAITNGVCIAFVTHLSKATQDYNFDKITGSVGLQGMTDAMWLIDRGDNSPNASITGRGRDILDFEYAVKWNDETMTYDYMGNKVVIEMNENRKLILDAMKSLKDGGVSEVRPSDVIKYYGEKATSKKGKNISRTMQRMADDFEIQSLPKYGFYSLITPEDLNKNLNHDHF